jgi:hypothetical protein
MRLRVLLVAVAFVVACGKEAAPPLSATDAEAMADSLMPVIARVAGLPFKQPPKLAVRSKAQIRAYVERKMATDLPPAEMDGVTAAYRLFGMIPDTLDLRRFLVSLYDEQVAGLYDPDSATLYVLRGSDLTLDPAAVRLTIAHELVHALQGQYVPLNDVIGLKGDNDRRTAAQTVMEGQATLVSMLVISHVTADDLPRLWGEDHGVLETAQQMMPVFASAPPIIRQTLVFPYFAGADFVKWFRRAHPGAEPFGPALPTSTEQILHPDRYAAHDEPVPLRFEPLPQGVVWDDNLGELETGVLLTTLSGRDSAGNAGASGWGGDRYVIVRTGADTALVWWSVWDTPAAAGRFHALLSRYWGAVHRSVRRRFSVDSGAVSGHPAVRLVDAPTGWSGWSHPPGVVLAKH